MLPGPFRLIISAVALIAVACSSGEPGALPDDRGPTPTMSATPTTDPVNTGRPSPGTTPSDGGVTAQETPAPSPPPPGKAAQNIPPEAGTYRYRQSGDSAFGDIPDEGTLVIRAATLTDGGQRQRQVRTISDSQAAEQTYLFRKDAVLIEEIKQRVGSGAFAQTFTCTMQPPLEAVRLPAKVGAAWKGTSSCQGLDITFAAKILREETRTVAGQKVETFVLRATFEAKGDGIEQTTTTTSWISPDHRLIVRSVQTSSGRQGAFEFESSLTEDLLNLRPE